MLPLVAEEVRGEDDADSSRGHVPRDDRVSTGLLYLVGTRVEAGRDVLFVRQATSRVRGEDTNLEACRHLECIERVQRRHH